MKDTFFWGGGTHIVVLETVLDDQLVQKLITGYHSLSQLKRAEGKFSGPVTAILAWPSC